MVTWEFDEDGDLDVISASAHRFGIWWHEPGADGPDNWKTHEISKALSQTHAAAFTDLNKDGHQDLITRMRYFATLCKEPGKQNAQVPLWFEFVPGKLGRASCRKRMF